MGGILIPIDFSPCSINALKYGLSLASKWNSNVYVVHGYHIPIPAAEFSMGLSANMVQEFKNEAEEKFQILKKEIPQLNTVSVNFNVRLAFALDAILSAIEEEKPNLVIMGTKGSSGLAEVVLGSNTSGVIRNSKVPVIAVPQNFTMHGISSIAFACDFEPIEELSKLDLIKRFADLNNTRIQIIHISKNGETASVEHSKEAKELGNFFDSVHHDFHYLESDDVAMGIEDFLNENNVEMLAMIPRKHTLIEKLFKRSITQKIAQHCDVPLLAIHA